MASPHCKSIQKATAQAPAPARMHRPARIEQNGAGEGDRHGRHVGQNLPSAVRHAQWQRRPLPSKFKSSACLFEPPAAASDRIAQRGRTICSTTTFGAACGRIQYRQRGRLVYAEPLQASCAVVSDAGRCGVERVARRLERPRAAPCGMPASRRCGSFAFPPAHPPAPAHAPPVQALSSRKGTRTD